MGLCTSCRSEYNLTALQITRNGFVQERGRPRLLLPAEEDALIEKVKSMSIEGHVVSRQDIEDMVCVQVASAASQFLL